MRAATSNDISVEAEVAANSGTAQLARFAFSDGADRVVPASDVYQLDLALTPRPPDARGQYSHANDFEYRPLGRLWMVPPGRTVRFRSGPGTTLCIRCRIEADAVAKWLQPHVGWAETAIENTLDMPMDSLGGSLTRLARELRDPSLGTETMTDLICRQITIEISRYQNLMGNAVEARAFAPWRLQAVLERLNKDGPAPTLEELATICRMSVRQLTRSFRAAQAGTIGELISERRIARAKELLNSRKSFKTITRLTGFASPSGFTYAFRKATGETPRAYRERLAEDAWSAARSQQNGLAPPD